MKLMKVHNNLVDARYSLNLVQSKIFAYMVSQVFSNEDKLLPFKGSAADLCTVAGISRNYERLQQSMDSLHDIKFSLRMDDHVLKFYMFHRVRYYDSGRIEIQFHEDMEPLLLNLKKNFTTAELEFFLRAKSHASNRFYLICKRYLFKGEYDIGVDDLKKMLLGEGDHTVYKLYADFKKRVLIPAINDINTMTDLKIEYKERKKGKAVAVLVFKIYNKPKQVLIKPKQVQTSELIEAHNRSAKEEKVFQKQLKEFEKLPKKEQGEWIERGKSSLFFVEGMELEHAVHAWVENKKFVNVVQ